jgi:uncharacterized protein DUF5615
MRFLADENFPGDAVTALRAAGHDVLWIRIDAPGITDQVVLARSWLSLAAFAFAFSRRGHNRLANRPISSPANPI